MSDLYWPGDQRAGDHGSDDAYLRALTGVELAWLAGLVGAVLARARTTLERRP